ncbi:hypothetical protein X474_03025 [Dethiosulfatarculus sandiegensis]|uniref:Uncharacterized protein n=1 Tax=Dethiosulfatarculus sandiegensis TaxID=1429043 RepID=A0A0D2GM13_9BACT|nr:hypothetical protein X474_03025 [Dethiosulfatarculus sandiegensis]
MLTGTALFQNGHKMEYDLSKIKSPLLFRLRLFSLKWQMQNKFSKKPESRASRMKSGVNSNLTY